MSSITQADLEAFDQLLPPSTDSYIRALLDRLDLQTKSPEKTEEIVISCIEKTVPLPLPTTPFSLEEIQPFISCLETEAFVRPKALNIQHIAMAALCGVVVGIIIREYV